MLREQGLPAQELYIRFFAVGLYYLLKPHIQQINFVLIDMEYPGLEAVIKQRLYNLFRRAGIRLNPNQIAFGFIGKKSAAHRIALATFQRKQLPDLILAVEDVLSEFWQKNWTGAAMPITPGSDRPVKDKCSQATRSSFTIIPHLVKTALAKLFIQFWIQGMILCITPV